MLIGLTLGLGLAAPASVSAWCRMTTAQSGSFPPDVCDTINTPLEWRRPCIQYAIHQRGARDFSDEMAEQIVDTSFQSWMDVSCEGSSLDFQLQRRAERISCDKAEYNTGAGNVNAVVFVDDWSSRPMYDPRAFALTTVWHNTGTGEVYDADIEVNEEIGIYAECDARDGCDDGRIDLQNVLTHEIGHFFTMAHSDNNISTMWWMADPGDIDKRILRTDDIEGICAVYPPGTLTAACDFTERGGFSGECGGGGGGCCAVGGAPAEEAPLGALAIALVALAVGARRRR